MLSKVTEKKALKLLKEGQIDILTDELTRNFPSPNVNWKLVIEKFVDFLIGNQQIIKNSNFYDYFNLIDEIISDETLNVVYKIVFSCIFKDIGDVPEEIQSIDLEQETLEPYLNKLDENSRVFFENNFQEYF